MAPWDSELLKFVNDPRYLSKAQSCPLVSLLAPSLTRSRVVAAVKTLQERRDLFDSYCKELLRASRAAKKTALEAGGGKVDVRLPFSTSFSFHSCTYQRLTHFSFLHSASLATCRLSYSTRDRSYLHSNSFLRFQARSFEGSSIQRLWEDRGR